MYLGLGCNTTITTVFSIPSTKIKSGKESKKGRKITIKPTGKDRKKLKTSPQNTVFLTSKVYLTLPFGLDPLFGRCYIVQSYHCSSSRLSAKTLILFFQSSNFECIQCIRYIRDKNDDSTTVFKAIFSIQVHTNLGFEYSSCIIITPSDVLDTFIS